MKKFIKSTNIATLTLAVGLTFILQGCSVLLQGKANRMHRSKTHTHVEYMNSFESMRQIQLKFRSFPLSEVQSEDVTTLIYSINPNNDSTYKVAKGYPAANFDTPQEMAYVLFQLKGDEVIYWETKGVDYSENRVSKISFPLGLGGIIDYGIVYLAYRFGVL